jgi:glycosyltransferase involved in cell wall biosynthesis
VPGFEERYNYLYPILRPVLRIIWRNAQKVIAISGEHQRLALQTMPGLDIPIMYNGVEIDVFHPRGEPKSNESINILCVGRLIERKGQHYLINAFAALKHTTRQPVHLTLVGTGDFESQLRSIAKDLDLRDSITFKGFVPREIMPEVYRDADIFVLPSQSEGMSIALLEAMASGLPLVVTNTGGVKELVEDQENGLIIPWADTDALSQALKDLVEDPGKRKEFHRKNLVKVKSFSWDTIVEQYLSLFYKLVESG